MRKAGMMGMSLLVVGGLMGVNCFADDGGRAFAGQLVGSSVGQHVAGVASGGAPWKISVGQFVVTSNGHIEVVIRGLLISAGAANNTVGPVTMVDASLVCGDVVAATTKAVPLSTTGDAQITDMITVPSPCIAPAVLVRVAAITSGPLTNGPFIAVNALVNSGPNNDNRNQNDDDR